MLKFVGALVVASLIAVGLAFILARVRFDRKPDDSTPNKEKDK